MKIIALTLLVWLISAQYASDELPTLDVRNSANQVMDESYKMKIEKSDSYFKIILDYNPSTGYQWYRLSNQAHNCLSKIKLVDQKVIEDYEGPRRMGASQTLEQIYWAEFIGKQDLVLVYSRFEPNSRDYEEYAINSAVSRKIEIDIGDNQEMSSCQS